MRPKRALISIQQGQAVSATDVGDAVLEHLDGLYRFALRLTRNPHDAQELAQETAVRAWERQQIISVNPRAWLFQTLYHTFINSYRHRNRWSVTGIDPEEEGGSAERHADPLPAIIAKEDVRRALEGLPEQLRAVVWLSDAEELSLREIAQILDWPIGTVASRLWRARHELRNLLSAYGPKLERQP